MQTRSERLVYAKNYRDQHKKEYSDYWKTYYAEHKDARNKKHREYYSEHKNERSEYVRKYNQDNWDRVSAYRHNYNLVHKDRDKERQEMRKDRTAIYYAEHREELSAKRRKALLKTYGLIPEQYDIMYVKQSGCCAICGKHQSELNRKLFVDHDHITGIVRGLLCRECNLLIGHAFEKVSVLEKAIQYLQECQKEFADAHR